jgi:hypothetical protein
LLNVTVTFCPHLHLQAEALISRVRRVTVETDQRLGALEAEYQRNKELVAGMLLQIVLSIDNPYTPK